MKNKDHLEDLFRTVRELPPDVEFSDVEKFVLAQPVIIYQSAPTMGGGKGLYTFKNIIAMISSISLIGTAVFFLGKGDPKPSTSAVPLPDTAPYVTPMAEASIPADLSAPAPKADSTPVPTEGNRSAYPFPVQSDTAPLSEGLIGPRSLTVAPPVFPAAPEKKQSSECDDDRHIISLFSKELRKDGIIRADVTKFGFRISHKEFFVNGKKQPQKVFSKYVDLFGKQLGRKDVRGAEMSATVGPGNCSISLSLDDSWDGHTSAPVSTSVSSSTSASVNTGTSVVVSASSPLAFENFTQVEVRGSGHVKITAGEGYSVSSEEKGDLSGVGLVEKGARLVISQSDSHGEVWVIMPADRLKDVGVSGSGLAVLTTPFAGVTSLKVAGSGTIKVEKGIDTPELSIQVQGSGRILAREMKADKLTGLVSGSGSIDASGNAGNLLNSISGSGLINMDKLDTDSVDCEILGSGTVRIGTVRTKLKANIQGSGGVSYSGTPTVEKKISGSGSVNAR